MSIATTGSPVGFTRSVTCAWPDAYGGLYYARFWAFTYYLACERPEDLVACLRKCSQSQGPRDRAEQSWVRLFEGVFGDDYAALERDMAGFLIRMFNENDEFNLAEERAWRAQRRREGPP